MAGFVHIWPKIGLKQPSIFSEKGFSEKYFISYLRGQPFVVVSETTLDIRQPENYIAMVVLFLVFWVLYNPRIDPFLHLYYSRSWQQC